MTYLDSIDDNDKVKSAINITLISLLLLIVIAILQMLFGDLILHQRAFYFANTGMTRVLLFPLAVLAVLLKFARTTRRQWLRGAMIAALLAGIVWLSPLGDKPPQPAPPTETAPEC
jgi:Na+/proline symporter